MKDKDFMSYVVEKADFYEDEGLFDTIVEKIDIKNCVKLHLLQKSIMHIFKKEKDYILASLEENIYAKWYTLKELHPDEILLMKNEKFYECYNEDAKKVAAVFGTEPCEEGNSMNYIYRVAIPSLHDFLPEVIQAGYHVITF